MANPKHLKILRQGVRVWNQWREENPLIHPDVSDADHTAMHLSHANFGNSDLSGAILFQADLCSADLSFANLEGADLSDADLKLADLAQADLIQADLAHADLSQANLNYALLTNAELYKADLNSTNFKGANLNYANLADVDLAGADLTYAMLRETVVNHAICAGTLFVDVALETVVGLDTTIHWGPSSISENTLVKSQGKISDDFLKGCGLADWQVEMAKLHDPHLDDAAINDIIYKVYDLRSRGPLQISPLFISYSYNDNVFVEQVEAQLRQHGIRWWRDVHHATAGPLEKIIDRAIVMNPTMLLVLSEHSVRSDWVEWEVGKARELEKRTGRHVLCPVALDDAWRTCDWSDVLRKQIMKYHIMDFSSWQNTAYFRSTFERLLHGLGIFYTQP